MASLNMIFTHLNGVENNEEEVELNSFYISQEGDQGSEEDEKDNSGLYDFMYESFFMEIFSAFIKDHKICDYCDIRDKNILLINENIESELLNKLDFPVDNLATHLDRLLSFRNEKCNLCDLLTTFKFYDLHYKLSDKLMEFCVEEYILLKEMDSKLAEKIYESFNEFNFDSEADLTEKIDNLERLYVQMKEKDEFLNILVHLWIRKMAGNGLLSVIKANTIGHREVFSIGFLAGLGAYKDYLDENSEKLFEIQKIVENDFQIENGEKIKAIYEIINEVERVQRNKELQGKDFEKNITQVFIEKFIEELNLRAR
ncbi:MAG: hypothetical protein C5B43_03255 [Verrucomicrobia bacterium]|nr:MAG: hypothetical protein C5B43_03255 [Verrucomicrobiota bacterium]